MADVQDVQRSLPVVLEDGGRRYVWGLGLSYATSLVTGDVEAVYHADGLGSVRALTDGAGAVTASYSTDPWGSAMAGGLPEVTPGQPFRYTGEQVDAETGLLHLRARQYDPGTGRLLQRDRVPGSQGAPTTLNHYAYVLSNPINYTDPSGNCPMCAAAVGIAIVAVEVGLTVADAVSTIQTVVDPDASGAEKFASVALFGAGLVAPGGGGSTAARAGRNLPFASADRITEINRTLDRVESGGPFPYRQDGTTFRNDNGVIPVQPEGYYREYTVDSPGVSNQGGRRIVQGEGGETYYTDDHYGSFVQIDPR